MPSINGNAALDVLVGMFFLYFLLSIVCSSVNEGIAVAFKLRAKSLEDGIRSLLDGDANAQKFFAYWRIQALVNTPKSSTTGSGPGAAPTRTVKPTARKPSYIPSRAFALTLLDTFAPPNDKPGDRKHKPVPSHDLIARAENALRPKDEQTPVQGEPLTETVEGLLRDALDHARGDIDQFRASLEHSFDDVMDRVSGWYKRRAQIIMFGVAIGLAVLINADSLAIAQRLWKDDALRAATVAQVTKAVQAGKAICPTPQKTTNVSVTTPQGAGKVSASTTANTPSSVADCVNDVKAIALPIGWSHANSPHSILGGFGKAIGLLVTAFALTLGAPFWFDLLGKVANLRGSGPPTPGAANKPSPVQPVQPVQIQVVPTDPGSSP